MNHLEPRVVMFDAAYPPPFRGGKERQAHLLSCALRDLGVSVRALTLRMSAGQPDELDGIRVTRCDPGAGRFAAIFADLRRGRPEGNVCHVHTPSRIGVYVGAVARWLGYRAILKIPNEGLTRRDGPRRHTWIAALRVFHRLIVLDDKIRREYEEAGIDPARIVLASNGVVVQERRVAGVQAGRPVRLLFLGRFVEQKGCRELLEVARLLRQRAPDWRLTMMGAGPLETELRATIAASGLSDRVDLRPPQDEVETVLREADIVVVPSRREGMPNVVLEAMSVGVPVVATDVGAVRRVLGDEAGSCLVRAGDQEGFSEAVLALMRDPAGRDACGARLHARARGRFDMALIARQYQQLYKQVLSLES